MSFYQTPTRFSDQDYAYQQPPPFQGPSYNIVQVESQQTPRPIADSLERPAVIRTLHDATVLAMELSAKLRLQGLSIYDETIRQMLAHAEAEIARHPQHQELISQFLASELRALSRDLATLQQITMVNTARVLELPALPDNRR